MYFIPIYGKHTLQFCDVSPWRLDTLLNGMLTRQLPLLCQEWTHCLIDVLPLNKKPQLSHFTWIIIIASRGQNKNLTAHMAVSTLSTKAYCFIAWLGVKMLVLFCSFCSRPSRDNVIESNIFCSFSSKPEHKIAPCQILSFVKASDSIFHQNIEAVLWHEMWVFFTISWLSTNMVFCLWSCALPWRSTVCYLSEPIYSFISVIMSEPWLILFFW